MKRQYMTPTVLVVKLQQRHHMLCGSPYGAVQSLSNPSEEGFELKEGGFEEYEDDM